MSDIIMFRSSLFALPCVVALIACGGATEPTSEINAPPAKTPATTPAMSTGENPADDGLRVDSSEAPQRVTGPAPASLSSAFVIEGQTLGTGRSPDDTCTQNTVRYAVDLAKKHMTVERCDGGPSPKKPWNTHTIDRDLTDDEASAIQKQFDELQELTMPAQCGYDGRAYRLEVAGKEYLDDDYNCMHRTGYYVTHLRPLAVALAALDGSIEPW